MSKAKQIANELIQRAKASYPKALEIDHREVVAYLDGVPYDATAVRVELGYAADYRERLTTCPEWLSWGYVASEAGESSWMIMAKTH